MIVVVVVVVVVTVVELSTVILVDMKCGCCPHQPRPKSPFESGPVASLSIPVHQHLLFERKEQTKNLGRKEGALTLPSTSTSSFFQPSTFNLYTEYSSQLLQLLMPSTNPFPHLSLPIPVSNVHPPHRSRRFQ
ncbi:hypothetical protein BU24DRAFT_135619 [Aaosphaeria arxii CBS 175.79]|uniref:Uncharacterized protein n=1 Tax=Aaosphaeria arxii CBS 175.79 TaxID=1450172 RepID=A0A6A5Y5V4_9PLEO|nr:uncharacterized protein BU24DRAFT_135619 [Aaosphaeria arxii CBS 175.79]KAF2020231.1 hypothetical protein BU24DRAFT_135619 [Aaosphaeria arxii CBS 175.79]